MDSDHLETTLADALRGKEPPRRRPQPQSRFPCPAAGVSEDRIRQQLAQAEQLIRQQRPTTALALLQGPGAPPADWPRRWHLRWFALVGWALIQHHQPRAASGVLQEGLDLFEALRHQPQAAPAAPTERGDWLCYFLGVSYCQGGLPVQALQCHRQGLAAIIDGTIRDPELTMLLYQGLGNAYLALGSDAEAIACLTLARERGQDVCNPYAEGMTEWSLGRAYAEQGNWPQAKRALTEALHRFEQLAVLPMVARVRACLGQVLLELQHEEEAEAMLRQALGGAERLADPQTCGGALGSLARLHLARGKAEHAIRLIQRGLAILQETQDHLSAGQLSLTLARAYEAGHDQEAAEEALKRAIGLLHSTPHSGLIARAHERYGQFLADQRRFREAFEQLRIASQTDSDAARRYTCEQHPSRFAPRRRSCQA